MLSLTHTTQTRTLYRSIKHHRMMGRWFWIFMTIHFIIAMTYIDLGTLITTFDDPVAPLKATYGFGFLAWLTATIICLTALNCVRRKNYEAFQLTHRLLTKVCYVFGALHLKGAPVGAVLMIAPLVVWTIEFFMQNCGPKKRSGVKCVTAKVDQFTTHLILDSGAKGRDLIGRDGSDEKSTSFTEPGDYCFLEFPQISSYERHPFSLCGPPGTNRLEFRIKAMGETTFTGRLHEYVHDLKDPSELQVKVTGPYGKLSVQLQRYEHVILVAGGIGVTPMMSTLHWLLDQNYGPGALENLKSVRFIWSVQKEVQLAWCESVLKKIKEKTNVKDFCRVDFVVELFVTRPKGGSGGAGAGAGSGGEGIEMTAIPDQQREHHQLSPISHVHPVNPDKNQAWFEHTDATTGKSYYYNKKTQETTWVRPRDMDAAPAAFFESPPPAAVTRAPSSQGPVWTKGRPNIQEIFSQYKSDATTCVLACGPGRMVDNVESNSRMKSFHFHKETFMF